LPERKYPETAFYDFEQNYQDAVDLIRSTFGDKRAEAVLAAKGQSTRSDFITAITWGWMFHRPLLSVTDRALILIGNETAKGLMEPLLDHAQLAMSEGLDREQVLEAIFTLTVYSGIPVSERASQAVESLIAELDRAGWKPRVAPGPLPDVPERDYYDFETNFTAGVDISLRNAGGGKPGDREARLSRMGASSVSDFGAIHWGWMNHRPFLEPRQRALVLLGSDTANKGYLALKDHVRWGLREGLSREQVNEGMFMLYMFNGWPANRQAMVAVTEVFEELDKNAT
jgi:alkylhydroperoxidase/carboxymuconolactone decarboxylase family protein YurZ